MLNIGAAVICILVGFIINLIGRRRTLLAICVPFLLGWILLITAINPVMLIVGRAFIGVACGAVCVAGPVCIESSYSGVELHNNNSENC